MGAGGLFERVHGSKGEHPRVSGPEMEPGHQHGRGYLKLPRLDKGMPGAKESRLGPGTLPVVKMELAVGEAGGD